MSCSFIQLKLFAIQYGRIYSTIYWYEKCVFIFKMTLTSTDILCQEITFDLIYIYFHQYLWMLLPSSHLMQIKNKIPYL